MPMLSLISQKYFQSDRTIFKNFYTKIKTLQSFLDDFPFRISEPQRVSDLR